MGKPSSRLWLIAGGMILCALIVTAVVLAVVLSISEEDDLPLSILFKQVPLIDGHNDLAYNIRTILNNSINKFDFDEDLSKSKLWNCSSCQTDLERLQKGMIGSQFWAAYVDCKTQYKDAVQQTLEQIDVIKRLILKYSSKMQLVTSSTGIWTALDQKKIGSLIGVEGGHSIDSRLAVLRQMYDLGVRYMTLTHTCNTPWADASPVDDTTKPLKPVSNGLSNFGKIVIYEMNRLGMMVDLSHVSLATMRDALTTSKAPVIFSHSSAYALCNHHRNVQDEILRKLASNGGIVMVNFYSGFVVCNSSRKATLNDVAAHINYIRQTAGVDHVGIGGDYDGVDDLPAGLEDVSKYPELFGRLIGRQGDEPEWTIDDLKKLAGLNLIRVFKKVEEVRDAFSNQPPYEDLLPISDLNQTSCYTNKG